MFRLRERAVFRMCGEVSTDTLYTLFSEEKTQRDLAKHLQPVVISSLKLRYSADVSGILCVLIFFLLYRCYSCRLLPKSLYYPEHCPQAGERCGEDSYDDKEEQFDNIVNNPLPICPSHHLIRNVLFHKEIA